MYFFFSVFLFSVQEITKVKKASPSSQEMAASHLFIHLIQSLLTESQTSAQAIHSLQMEICETQPAHFSKPINIFYIAFRSSYHRGNFFNCKGMFLVYSMYFILTCSMKIYSNIFYLKCGLRGRQVVLCWTEVTGLRRTACSLVDSPSGT